ncbi:MAG: hypothetical protein L3J35_03590 [Bacteroidales bacterium]|nr:hypothetical protein [Bacteroidales bacterium]
MSNTQTKPAGAFTLNRNNEITDALPELKKLHKTSNNTTAIYKTVEDYLFLTGTELNRLYKIEKEHKALKKILQQKRELERKLNAETWT